MSSLPLEVWEEIATKLAHSTSLDPINIYNIHEDSRYDLIKRYPENYPAKPDQALFQLRLVSKAFHQVATRVLFRNHRATWQTGGSNWSSVDGVNAFNEGLEKFLCDSINIGPMIRNLKLKILISTTDVVENGTSRKFLQLLPNALQKLSNLNCLSMDPGSLASDVPDHSAPYEPRWDYDYVSQLLSGLVTVFRSEKLENLTDLRLLLPCTHHFGAINASISDTFANRLVCLYLGVTDRTGPGGSSDYLLWFNRDSDGDEEYELSNLQKEFPNQEYDKEIFDIVSRCHNLEVLGLKGTQRLDMKKLDWRSSRNGLRAIDLDRVKISSEALVKILSPPEGTPLSNSILRNINFAEVDLETGSWEDIFTFLSGLPSLLFFNPENLRYTRGHPSFTTTGGRAWEDSLNIWTRMEEDVGELSCLAEVLVAKAGGRDKYPNYWMEQNMLE